MCVQRDLFSCRHAFPHSPPVAAAGHGLENSSSPTPGLPVWSHLELWKRLAVGPGGLSRAPTQSPWTPCFKASDHLPALQKMGELPLGINIQEPRWDQSTFMGRARHFFTVTDPRNLLLSEAQLEASRNIVQNYR